MQSEAALETQLIEQFQQLGYSFAAIREGYASKIKSPPQQITQIQTFKKGLLLQMFV